MFHPFTSSVLLLILIVKSTGDDDVAYRKNRDELKKEVCKAKQRKEVILALARETFPERRSSVLSESEDVSATSLLMDYPEFYKPYVVSSLYSNIITHEQCIYNYSFLVGAGN